MLRTAYGTACPMERSNDPSASQELEAEAQKLQLEIPAIGTKSERLTAELAKQEQV